MYLRFQFGRGQTKITESGAIIGGISNLRYADDTALCGKCPQEINNTVNDTGRMTTKIECPENQTYGTVEPLLYDHPQKHIGVVV